MIKKKYIVIFAISIVLIISLVSITFLYQEEPVEIESDYISYVETTTTDNTKTFYVDLKGAVKKPGVYKVKEGTIVNELIKLAGGLKKNAYTDNINLAKAVSSQEVIYINTVNEIKTTVTTQSLVTTSNIQNTSTKLININTASINELTSLSGIGESKALAIVAYRTQSPFKSIEEIKNVDGIGDSAFAKIKDNITI